MGRVDRAAHSRACRGTAEHGAGPFVQRRRFLVAAAWTETSGPRGGPGPGPVHGQGGLDRSLWRARSTPHSVPTGNASPWRPGGTDGARRRVRRGRPARRAFGLSGPNCCIPPVLPWGVLESGWPIRRREQREQHASLGGGDGKAPLHPARSHRVRASASPGARTRPAWSREVRTAPRRCGRSARRAVRELWSLSAQETRSGIVEWPSRPTGPEVMAGDAGISAVQDLGPGPNGGAEWANLPAPGDPAAEFMPDGRRMVARSPNDVQSLTIWDLETGRDLRTFGPARDDVLLSSTRST